MINFEQLFYLPPSMLWPLAACLVLTGIHVYLGVHVIARKVIFVDLALAQIAALGTVVGVLMGYEVGKDTNALYLYSLTFTIFGAFLFSVTRMRGEKVPHEAIIGIVYAVTFASTILVLSKSALGPQELDHIIKGELLWVQSHVVIKTAIIYALVGLFHFIFRKRFMAISFDPALAEASGTNVRFWDFLFYMSFGFVITSSVAIAGVFLVFSYLVIPSVAAMLLSDKLSTRLTIGWIGGSIISFIGVKISYNTGLPTSPVIVVILALGLIVSGLSYFFMHAERKWTALRHLMTALIIVALFLSGIFFFRKPEEDPLAHTLHLLASPLSTDRQAGLANLSSYLERKDQWIALVVDKLNDQDAEVRKGAIDLLVRVHELSAVPGILLHLNDPSDDVRSSAIAAASELGDSSVSGVLLGTVSQSDDPEVRLSLLKGAIELGNRGAVRPLIDIISGGGVFADDAFEILRGHIRGNFTKNDAATLRVWWENHASRIVWDRQLKMFVER
jgi:zinc/manganese transport system permease protein